MADPSLLASDAATLNYCSGVTELIKSDHDYFKAGAIVDPVAGGLLVWDPIRRVEGIILMTDPSAAEANLPAWVCSMKRAQLYHGVQRLRVYTQEMRPLLSQTLSKAGFKARVELLFTGTPNKPISTIELRPVLSDRDWQKKLMFHEQASERPDGYACSAAEWVAFEKGKVASLGMQPFLAWCDSTVVGAVSTITTPALLRVKNLVIHPEWRGKGIAKQILGELAGYGELSGTHQIGMMAVAGTGPAKLYRQTGLTEQGKYYEWSI